ncbi:hypothetical protein [Thiocystis violascens]|nr:hypothetical protein [Thiocystis violascens]
MCADVESWSSPKIHEAEQAVLRQIVTDRPTSTLSEGVDKNN